MIEKAYIISVNGNYYISKEYIYQKDILKLKDALLLMVAPSDKQTYAVNVSVSLFGDASNLDLEIINPQNIQVYEAEKKLIEQYYNTITQIKTNIVTVKDVPKNFANQILNLKK